jgi:hypothetical protein
MSRPEIEQMLSEDLLKLLPTPETMEWRTTTALQAALVIGGNEIQELVVCQRPCSDDLFHWQYFLGDREFPDRTLSNDTLVLYGKAEAWVEVAKGRKAEWLSARDLILLR